MLLLTHIIFLNVLFFPDVNAWSDSSTLYIAMTYSTAMKLGKDEVAREGNLTKAPDFGLGEYRYPTNGTDTHTKDAAT